MNKKLLGHLKSADFFDVEKNPEGIFELTDVRPYTGDAIKDTIDPRQEEINKYKVTDPTHFVSGNLTLKGINEKYRVSCAYKCFRKYGGSNC